jgi:ribosomal protein L16 Arg81 hydroxylase
MKELASLLAPFSIDVFLSQYWTARELVVRGEASKFTELFSWAEFNAVLNQQHRNLQYGELKLAKDGRTLPAEAIANQVTTRKRKTMTRLSARKILALFGEGATIIVNHVERYSPALGALAGALEQEIGEPVQINAYCTPPQASGFAPHYDTHEAFVLQVEGTKHWRAGGVTRPYPLATQKSVRTEAPRAAFNLLQLSKGDLMYIPRGLWHEASTTSEPSLHLTVGVHCRTGVDLLLWAAGQLSEIEEARRNLPKRWGEGQGSQLQAAETAALLERLLVQLSNTAGGPDVAARFDAQTRPKRERRKPGRFALPQVGPGEHEDE